MGHRKFFKRQIPPKNPQQLGMVAESIAVKKLQQLSEELEVSRAEVFEFMMETAEASGFMREKRISAITARLREIQNHDIKLRDEERKLHTELKQLKNNNNQTGDN